MVFGLIQWIASFIIFIIVLTIITWSAVHLGKKEQNATAEIMIKILGLDHIAESKSKLHSSAIGYNLTLQVLESTIDPTLFADNQGSEVPDSAEVDRIFQAFYSTQNNSISSNENNNATSMFIASTATYNQSDKSIALDNQNITKAIHRYITTKITNKTFFGLSELSDISQTMHSTETYKVTFSDTDSLQKSTLSQGKRLNLSKITKY